MNDDNRPTGPNQDMPDDGSARRPTGEPAPRTPDNWPQNQSRRRFLKAALISSAAGLAAGGATYAAIESVASKPISSYTFIGQSGSPGASTGTACTTGTDPTNYKSQTEFKNNEAIFLWALFTNLPGGSYSLSVSPEIETSAAICTPTVTNPFTYLGNPVNLYNLGTTKPSWTCSPPNQSVLPSTQTNPATADTVEDLGTFSVSAGDYLLLQVHMQNGCDPAGVYTVTINLAGPVNLSPSATITIDAKKK